MTKPIKELVTQKLARVLLAGLAFRVLLMPFTFHSDLLFIHYFPSFLVRQGVWDIYGYFGDHFIKQVGYTYYPPMGYFLTAIGQKCFAVFHSGFGLLLDHFHQIYYQALQVADAEYFKNLTQNQIFQVIFLMKLHYLVADAVVCGVIWHIFHRSDRDQAKALSFWCLSPIVLFSTYMMGQYRLFTALFFWVTLWAFGRKRLILGSLALSAACLCDSTAFFLILPTLLIFPENLKSFFKMTLTLSVVLGAVLIPLALSSDGAVFLSYFSPLLQKQSLQGIFRHSTPELAIGLKMGFVLTYLTLIFLLLNKRDLFIGKTAQATFIYATVSAVFYLILYSTTSTVVHYFMWALPFLIFLRVEGNDKHRRVVWAIFVLLFLFNLDSRRLNLGFFLPMDPVFWTNLPSFHEWVNSYFSGWGKVIAGARALFSVTCVYLAWQFIREGFFVEKKYQV